MRINTRRAGLCLLLVAATPVLSAYRFSGFNDRPARAAAARATEWLVSKQRPGGGFELAGFAGFETPDAVLALAEQAQTKPTWDAEQARRAVRSTLRNGRSPLDFLDDFADAPELDAGQAAKLVVLVAAPLGLPVRRFNPQGDATARNLLRVVNQGRADDGSYGAFNATLYAVVALALLDQAIDPATVALIRAAQDTDGGWNYTGTAGGADSDADTTSLAVQALVAAGATPSDGDLIDGLEYLARSQQASGAWQSFGTDDPNSTSMATLAIVAMGYGPKTPCWRNVVAPDLADSPYVSPLGWLRSQQQANGRIASPNDAFGVNTFPTSQTIEALRRGWLPVFTQPKAAC